MRAPELVVTGAGGQLGSDVLRLAPGARGCTRAQLDIADPSAVRAVLSDLTEPARATVINCAAWTDVDGAETAEPAAARANGEGPAVLAAECARLGTALVHLSTDYVFAGDATSPYPEDAPPAPRSAYGRTKLAGERAVRTAHPDGSWVVRTAWVYGRRGPNFVQTMAALAASRPTVEVVDDQRGSPTWSADLAAGLLALAAARPRPGIYHATGGGVTSWYELARAVFEEIGADPDRVHPTSTAAFPRPAPRPAYSALSDRAWRQAGLAPLPPWRQALGAAFRAGVFTPPAP